MPFLSVVLFYELSKIGERGNFPSRASRDARKHMRMVADVCKERGFGFSLAPKIVYSVVVPITTVKVVVHNRNSRKDVLQAWRIGRSRLANFQAGAKRSCIRNGMLVL